MSRNRIEAGATVPVNYPEPSNNRQVFDSEFKTTWGNTADFWRFINERARKGDGTCIGIIAARLLKPR